MLFMRTVPKDGVSRNEFQWKINIGDVNEALDWSPDPTCKGGLYGLPNGQGKGLLMDWSDKSIGLVFESDDWVQIDQRKAKAKIATIVFTGTIEECANYIYEKTGQMGIVGHTYTGGTKAFLVGGDFSTLIGGRASTLIGGKGTIFQGEMNASFSGVFAERRVNRVKTVYVGEGIILPGRKYFINERGRFEEYKGTIFPPKTSGKDYF